MFNKRETLNSLLPSDKEKKSLALRAELVSLGEAKALIESEIKILSKQRQDFSDVSQEILDANKELNSLKTEIVRYKTTKSDLEKANQVLISVNENISNVKNDLEDLTSEYEDKNKELDTLNSEFSKKTADYNNEILDLRKEITGLEEAKPKLIKELDKLKVTKDEFVKSNTDIYQSLQSETDDEQIILDNLLLDIVEAKKTYQQILADSKDAKEEAKNFVFISQSEATKIIADAKKYHDDNMADITLKIGDLSLREKWLSDKADNLKNMKEEIEARYGKKITSIIL
jgi:DNA repair exonuclease SbcCD ATPase subunit